MRKSKQTQVKDDWYVGDGEWVPCSACSEDVDVAGYRLPKRAQVKFGYWDPIVAVDVRGGTTVLTMASGKEKTFRLEE